MSHTVGIDVGGSNIKSVVRSITGETNPRPPLPTPDTADELIEVLANIVAASPPVGGVGVAVAGLVDRESGILRWGPHVPGTDLELVRRLTRL